MVETTKAWTAALTVIDHLYHSCCLCPVTYKFWYCSAQSQMTKTVEASLQYSTALTNFIVRAPCAVSYASSGATVVGNPG